LQREDRDPDGFFEEGLRLRGTAGSEFCNHFPPMAADAEVNKNTLLVKLPTADVWMVRFFCSAVNGRRTSDLAEDGGIALVVSPALPTVLVGEDCDVPQIRYRSRLECEK
jgi:hypothetical protein